jgi:tetratricopeptide (TPR) repeat protein
MNCLGRAYIRVGQWEKAIDIFQRTLQKRRRILGPNNADTLGTLNNLAQAYRFHGQPRKALSLYREALDQLEPTLGPDHFQTLATSFNLGLALVETDQPDQAVTLLEKTLSKSKVVPGPHHRLSIEITDTLATLYEMTGDYAKAGEAWSALVNAYTATRGSNHRQTIAARVQLGSIYLLQKNYPQAETELRACLQWRQRSEPDKWPTWNTRSLLGEALMGQQKYDAAEPLLLEGYKGMKRRQASIPGVASTRPLEAAQRLVDLYRAWKKPAQADRWLATVRMERAALLAKATAGVTI